MRDLRVGSNPLFLGRSRLEKKPRLVLFLVDDVMLLMGPPCSIEWMR